MGVHVLTVNTASRSHSAGIAVAATADMKAQWIETATSQVAHVQFLITFKCTANYRPLIGASRTYDCCWKAGKQLIHRSGVT